ncbi:MAG: InlB B-repeat-containing protein [Eubacteriales bacterium]|nr:InlB B-repeat-containing protein [Eubacteriales bacterium]
MKKKVWLLVSVFVLVSVTVYAVVGLVFFWRNRGKADAGVANKNSAESYYTVHFDSCGGSAVNDETVSAGGTVTKPKNPTFDGSEFLYWYVGSDDSRAFDFNTPINSDIMLYAKWKDIIWTVTFDGCGGSEVATQYVIDGKKVKEPTDAPGWDEYVFFGWYEDADYTKKFDFNKAVKGNVTLYAKWTVEFELSADGASYVLRAYNGTGNVVIPGTYKGKAVKLDGPVFYNRTDITSVEIESGVAEIGVGVFCGCTNLTTVVLPDTLTHIGSMAFAGCQNLTNINIPTSVTKDPYAFFGCPAGN